MHIAVLVLAAALQAAQPQDRYTLAGDIQAMYDELDQSRLSATTPEDVDDFHTVFCTSDWSFTDRSGVRRTWAEMRDQTVQAASEQPFDALRDVIRTVSVKGDTATTEVSAITIRTIVDTDGKYGTRGATHTIAEATPMRDRWLRTPGSWKFQAREQTGDPKQYIDKTPPEMDNPKPPSVKTS